MYTYNQDRIAALNDPWARLACAVIMQAVLDWRMPGAQLEISRFFHGPMVGYCGIDGDLLLELTEKVTKEV